MNGKYQIIETGRCVVIELVRYDTGNVYHLCNAEPNESFLVHICSKSEFSLSTRYDPTWADPSEPLVGLISIYSIHPLGL